MRAKTHGLLNKWRFVPPDRPEYYSDHTYGHNGMFAIPFKNLDGKVTLVLKVMGSTGDDLIPWEHVSVSVMENNERRCPTWGEMCYIKDIFWDEEECVLQYHPPKSDHINQHPYCLHLWKPIDVTLPRPPALAIGVSKQPSASRFSDCQAADIIDRMVNRK